MLDKPYSKAMQGGFQRAYNPHLYHGVYPELYGC